MVSRITLKNLGFEEYDYLQDLASSGCLRATVLLVAAEMWRDDEYLDAQQLAQKCSCHISIVYRTIKVFNTKGVSGIQCLGRPSKKWEREVSKSNPSYTQRHFDGWEI